MIAKSMSSKAPAERVLKDIRRATRRHFSAEDKIRIVLDGLRGEDSIAELCRREGIAQSGIVTLALVSHFWPLPEPAKSLEMLQRHEAERAEFGGELCQRDMASINSFVAQAGSGVYPVSKGAVAQFTRALASELAADGVRVNAIAPGLIATAMTEVTRADPKRLEAFLAHVPMKRVGQPEELIGPTVFLCSDAASYVTGTILPIDGGYLGV